MIDCVLDIRRVESSRKKAFRRPRTGPRILSVGTATPPKTYTQDDVLSLFQETDPKIESLFHSSHIETRHLYLPDPVAGVMPEESNQELLDKHLQGAMDIGSQAVERALEPLGLAPPDIDFFCCLTTTGFLCPGITAHLIRKMGFRCPSPARTPASSG